MFSLCQGPWFLKRQAYTFGKTAIAYRSLSFSDKASRRRSAELLWSQFSDYRKCVFINLRRFRSKLKDAIEKESEADKGKESKGSGDYRKLFRLAKPELPLVFAALGCLIVTSGVSMSLPFFIGKIIDTSENDKLESEKNDKKGADVDQLKDEIMGLQKWKFYSALGVFFAVGAVANFGRTYFLRSIGESLVARLRSRLFLKILSLDSYFFDIGPTKTGMKTGDLISRISSDTQIISKTLSSNISDGARALISGSVGISMMCFVLWKLTMYMSLMFPPLIAMSLFYGRRIKMLSRKIQENLGSMSKVTEERLNGLKTIQSFAQQKAVVHEFNKELRKIYQTSMREGKLSGIYYGGNGFLGNTTLIGLLVIGNMLIQNGELTVGALTSYMMYAVYAGSSVFGLGNFFTELMKGVGASDRVFELIEQKPKITTSLGKKVDNIYGDIVFDHVKFAYPSRLDLPLFGNKELDLTIRAGEHICFVGPSGSGKSSISQLLLRFYDPLQGRVLINGYDIRDLNLNFYRSKIGYVQQELLLFSGTIRDNITFGKHDATQEEVEEAAIASNAFGFIQEFPKKFDTIIGPSSNGTQLSGGQRQRISLARTLIKRPRILILDEATSALDSHLEEVVMRNLNKLSKEQSTTMILIAHRLSTIRNGKRIIVLNHVGEIVEDGEFNTLFKNPQSELNRLLKRHDIQ